MFIFEFVKALLPHIEKDTLVTDLRDSIKELDNVAIPSFKQASEFFRTYKAKSKEFDKLSTEFSRKYTSKLSKQGSFIGDISFALANVRENASTILDQAQDILAQDILNEGLTAKKAILIRAASAIAHITKYSTDLLNVCYDLEAQAVTKSDTDAISVPKYTVDKVSKGLNDFARILSDYSAAPDKFKKTLVSVPDLLINSQTADVVGSVYKHADIDPFSSGYTTNFTYNPIYHIRLVFAEWQANRVNEAKEKKAILELRLLHLKNSNEGVESASLEKQIQYTQDRIDKLERYVKNVEDDLGI